MRRRFAPFFAALLLIGLPPSGPPAILGQGKPASPKMDERLFLLYVLEDLHRSTWPPDRQSVQSSQQVKAVVAHQRQLVDRLRLHLEAQKMEPEFRAHFQAYRDLLELAEEFHQKLEDREREYFAPLEKLQKEFWKEDQLRRMRATAEVMNTAVEGGIAASGGLFSDPFDGLIGGLMAGMVKSMAVEIELKAARNEAFERLKADAQAYEDKNLPALKRDVEAANRDFIERFNPQRQARVADARQTAAVLAAKYGWNANEADFNPFRRPGELNQANRPRDPFLVKQVVNATPEPKNREAATVCLRNATDCLQAVRLVPPPLRGTAEVYQYYHAQLYGLAGRQANLAAAAQVGEAGFQAARSVRIDAAATAKEAWRLYPHYEKPERDVRGVVLHNTMLAYAYAGQYPEAYNCARSASKTQITNPTFWYDAARVCSLVRAPKDGFFCLQQAVRLGFKDLAKAKEAPDLDFLRRADPDRFAQIVDK